MVKKITLILRGRGELSKKKLPKTLINIWNTTLKSCKLGISLKFSLPSCFSYRWLIPRLISHFSRSHASESGVPAYLVINRGIGSLMSARPNNFSTQHSATTPMPLGLEMNVWLPINSYSGKERKVVYWCSNMQDEGGRRENEVARTWRLNSHFDFLFRPSPFPRSQLNIMFYETNKD